MSQEEILENEERRQVSLRDQCEQEANERVLKEQSDGVIAGATQANSQAKRLEDKSKGSTRQTQSESPGPKISTVLRDATIEYNSFAAFSRWRKQQEKAIAQDLKKILGIAIPLLLVCYFLGFSAIALYERNYTQKLMRATYQKRLNKYSDLIEYEQLLEKLVEPLKDEFLPESTRATFEIDKEGQIGPKGIRLSDLNSYGGKREIINKSLEEAIIKIQPFPAPPRAALRKGVLPVQLSYSFSAKGLLVSFAQDAPLLEALTGSKQYKQPMPDDDEQGTEFIRSFALLGGLIFFTAISILAVFSYICKQATHLSIGERGWRFLYLKKMRGKLGEYVNWDDMSKIYLSHPKGSTSPFDQLLCFKTNDGRIHKVKMGSIESLDDKQVLLNQIKKWGAKVKRSPDVMQALQAPADHSYTELWMQALSAAPKRERLKPLASGSELKNGRYKIISQIGSGGQGSAYLAKTTDSVKVVLKECILPVFVDINVRRAALESFEQEARLLRELNHPQIVELRDFFVEDHRSYLVLEHIDGKSLRQLVKAEGKLPGERVLQIAEQMCEILQYLHTLKVPIVHRDFTPDNLILRSDGRLKLIDFNVARQLVGSSTSGTVVGKHAYLPPEQFRGMPECASDIYAMGATLYFLLTGSDPRPLTRSDPRNIDETISEGIADLVSKATELDTEARYKSVTDVMKDLAELTAQAHESKS